MLFYKQEHYVYRYVLNDINEVIYIGKTDASLKQRIDAHLTEPKFQPYLGRWRVEFIELANSVETDIVEKFLINQLKPAINEKDCVSGITNMDITLPEWRPYSEYEAKILRDRAAINREQLKKLCEVLIKIRDAEKEEIVLPYVFAIPVYFRGKIVKLLDREVRAASDGYAYTLLPTARKYVSTHIYQMCADAYIKYCADIKKGISDDTGGAEEEYALAKEVAGILWEFKEDRYQSDLGMCTLLLPERYWKCANNFAGIIDPTCEGIYIVNPDEYKRINETLEHLAYCLLETIQDKFSAFGISGLFETNCHII